MQVQFNGEKLEIQDHTLADLLTSQQLAHKTGIAVAVNSRVIARDRWTEHQLEERDEILVITATAGG